MPYPFLAALFTHSIITAKLRIVAVRWVQEAYKSPSILEMLSLVGELV